MSITRKIASGASAAALATACLVTAGAGAASAAPSNSFTHCSIRNGVGYPPGKCFLRFDKGTYKRLQDVHFVSGTDFKAKEKLTVILRCAGGYAKTRNIVPGFSNHHVGPAGRVQGHLILTKHTPVGSCNVTITGHTSGSKVRGSFTVKK
jgi:hypothetical protein